MGLKPGRFYGVDWKLSIIGTLIFWGLLILLALFAKHG